MRGIKGTSSEISLKQRPRHRGKTLIVEHRLEKPPSRREIGLLVSPISCCCRFRLKMLLPLPPCNSRTAETVMSSNADDLRVCIKFGSSYEAQRLKFQNVDFATTGYSVDWRMPVEVHPSSKERRLSDHRSPSGSSNLDLRMFTLPRFALVYG